MRSMLRHTIGTTTFAIAGLVCALNAPRHTMAVDILDDQMQIDERITKLIQTSNSLSWEMYRYHQKQPDYADSYRAAKQLWTQASQIQEALRAGPVETEAMQQQVVEMNQNLEQVEASLLKWGPGDLSQVPTTSGITQREVVAPGVGFTVPFVGLEIGSPSVVVTEDVQPQLARRRLHANSHGSKRSLERELFGVRLAMNYLAEDAGVTLENSSQDSTASDAKQAPPAPRPGSEVVPQRKPSVPPAK